MLYIVATPIGNLSEITLRALETLKGADYILCEDCRHSLKLLNHYGISKPLVPHHKFNERAGVAKIVDGLRAGKNIALITDAGMPCISDPGGVLVSECIREGLEYTVVSGACAAVNAVVLSGFPSGFLFYGFLPDKKKQRVEELSKLLEVEQTLVFYSPPHSLPADLDDLFAAFGKREACLVREISKIHEEAVRFVLGSAPALTQAGECVLLVRGAERPDPAKAESGGRFGGTAADGAKPPDAYEKLKALGLSRNELYKLLLELKNEKKSR
jgi:16S rRNA (cytidine1402-2'-O)-methyltransferase